MLSPHARRWLPRSLRPGRDRRRGRAAGLPLRFEPLEARTVLSFLAFTTVADGLVADRNLDGTFETSDTTGSSITDRWFPDPTIGQERGVFEFDLSHLAPGTQILSATVGLQVTSFTASTLNGVTTDPQFVFRAAAGNGTVTTADATAPAVLAGSDTVSALGYQQFALNPAALQGLEGGIASLRLENTALNANWGSVASLEDPLRQHATLTLEIGSIPAYSLSITPGTVVETAGPAAATAVLTRTGDLSAPLTVNLSSDTTSQLAVPATATFAAGQSTVSFGVDAVDDHVYDGSHLVTVSATPAASTTPFGLDPTFGTGGLAPTSLTMRDQFPHAAVALQPDGKVLAASQYSGDSWQLTRLNPDGSLDTTFGNSGVALAKFPIISGTWGYPDPHRIVVQPDGKILVGGVLPEGTASPALCRFTATGQLDSTFGTGGIANLNSFGATSDSWVEGIAVRPDGRILLAMANDGAVYLHASQLNADGSLDTTFGDFGGTPRIVSGDTQSLNLLPNGQFLLAGSTGVARFNADGKTLDPTFGSGGSTTVNFGSSRSSISATAIDSVGRIIVAGDVTNPANGWDRMAAARLLPDGTLDPTFGSGGSAVISVSGQSDLLTSLAVQPDNKVILAGVTEAATNDYQSGLARLTASGVLDPTINGTGVYQQSLIPSKPDLFYGIALQPADGKLVALTGWTDDFRVARFTMANPAIVLASAQVTVLDNDNAPPVANAQSLVADENASFTGSVTASDPNGDALTYASVTQPAHGSLALAGNGAFTYTPSAGYFGTDSFTFKANDGKLDSNVATVSIVVNAPPVANAQAITTDETTAKTVTLTATDPDGNPLTYSVVAAPAHGTLSGTAPNLTYTPAAGYFGTDSFTFKANDGRLDSNVASVAIIVNAPPVANAQAVTTDVNTASPVTLTATDPDSNPLTYSIVATPGHGTLSGTAPNLTYTPNTGYFGSDSFTFKANDGRLDSNIASVSIVINAPPVAHTQAVTTDENVPETITLAATDPDGNPLTYSIVTATTHGTLSGTGPDFTYTPAAGYFGTDGFSFKVNDGRLDSNVASVSIVVNAPPVASAQSVTTEENTPKDIALVATDPDGNGVTYSIVAAPAHGTLGGIAPNLTYTPSAGYFGTDSFTFKANDGRLDSNIASVSIVVNAPPVAAGQSVTTDENVPTSIALAATDPDGDPLTYSIVTTPGHGILSGTAPNLTYTPNTGYFGTDSFTFKAYDGTLFSNVASVSIVVNAPPVASAQAVTTDENTSRPIVLAATDPDGNPLTYSVVAAPAHGTLSGTAPNLTYTPNTGYFGSDSFSFKANDGRLDSNVASVSIVVNAPPVASAQAVTTDENTSRPIALAATDPDGNALTYSIVAAPGHGTLSGTAPNLTYTPSTGYFGTDTFSFKANDGRLDSNIASVSIVVNAPPVASAQAVTTVENTPRTVTLAATDPDGNALTYSIVTAPGHGTLSGTAPNLTYTPAAGYFGTDSFTFKANDGRLDSNIATVSIVVSAPLSARDDAYAVAKNRGLIVGAPGVLANDTGPGGASLSATLARRPTHGLLNLHADGSFTYQPNKGFTGTDSFTYQAHSGALVSNAATVTINVGTVRSHGAKNSVLVTSNGSLTLAGSWDATDQALADLVAEPVSVSPLDPGTSNATDSQGRKSRGPANPLA